jgi:hypothetical protein
MSVGSSVRGKTGEVVSVAGRYQFDGYLDGTRWPAPTTDEQVEPFDRGDRFTPIRSCNKGCFWILIKRS